MRRAALVVVCAAACGAPRAAADDPSKLVDVLEESAVVKTGAIGVKDKQDATYVLVDAKNVSDRERQIAVEGTLSDDAGRSLGGLLVDEQRIPPGETRTFALLFSGVAPTGQRTSFHVRRAAAVDHPPPVVVVDPTTEKDGEALAAICRVQNQIDKTAIVTLLATFYDREGRILGRPFVLLELEPRSSRPFRFTGPAGSVRATMWVGDASY